MVARVQLVHGMIGRVQLGVMDMVWLLGYSWSMVWLLGYSWLMDFNDVVNAQQAVTKAGDIRYAQVFSEM